MENVIIYSTPTCVYCKMAKDYFAKNGVAYKEFDVAADDAAREEMIQKSHQMGVPVIDIGGEIFVGFNQKEVAKALGLS
jgi:glutaredoxin-like YruB-family protein